MPGRECRPGVSHPPSKRRRPLRKYWLFEAASAGCLRCVQYWVQDKEVDAASKSDTNNYTALDCAEWARQQDNVRTEEVEEYLRRALA